MCKTFGGMNMLTPTRMITSIFCIVFVGISAFADATLKVRQTVGGQTMENTTYIKGKRERTEQDFGGMKMINIKQCDLKRTIQLNPTTKMYIINSWAQDESLPTTSVTSSTSTNAKNGGSTTTVVRKGGTVTVIISLRDTGERKQMFGFTARHIIQTIQMESSADACDGEKKMKMETDGWYIDTQFAFDCGDDSQFRMPTTNQQEFDEGCRDRYEIKNSGAGRTGFALYEKTTMFDDSGKPPFSSTKEVLNLSYATLEASLFEAPTDYRVAKSMQEMFTGGAMFGGFNMVNLQSENNTSNEDSSDKPTDAGEKTANLGDLRASSQAGDKQSGVIRVGLSGIKTGSVGDGMNAQALAGAIQTSLGEYFKGTGVEIVLLEAKLSSAIEQEARNSNCDFVLFAQVSHKRGGGGFGGLRSIGNVLGGAVPYGGSVAGQVAAETARVTIWTAADAAASIKAKDELTLDVNLKKTDGSAALTRQFKSKAKSEGEDIISPIVEQATQAIVDFVNK